MEQDNSLSRRRFLQAMAAGGAAVGAGGLTRISGASAQEADTGRTPLRPRGGRSMIGVPFESRQKVRLGIVGVGNRGLSMLGQWLAVPDVEVVAVCDVDGEAAREAARTVREAGQPQPAVYDRGERDYQRLCQRNDLDFVYTATPWEWHYGVCMTAMRNGKHVGTEMPMAMELRDIWELVDTSERTRRHCIMMENISYGQNELRLLKMAHDGLFGELLHGAGGYIHDLRELMFSETYYEGQWRRQWHTRRDGSFYHMHGLAPIAACMDINRGDRFTHMMTVSSPSLSLDRYREENVSQNHPSWGEDYIKGDRTTSFIETNKGRFIRIEHDVSTPHPYTRINSIAGTKGVFEDFEPRIYLEPDMTDHQWGDFDAYADYDHWLWKDIGDSAEELGGHGGVDYIMLWRLAQTMKLGLVPDIDVYDSASWSAPVPLSTESIRRGSRPVKIPDFTRGQWQQYRDGLDTERPDGQSAAAAS